MCTVSYAYELPSIALGPAIVLTASFVLAVGRIARGHGIDRSIGWAIIVTAFLAHLAVLVWMTGLGEVLAEAFGPVTVPQPRSKNLLGCPTVYFPWGKMLLIADWLANSLVAGWLAQHLWARKYRHPSFVALAVAVVMAAFMACAQPVLIRVFAPDPRDDLTRSTRF
jgi:hypothetical protein